MTLNKRVKLIRLEPQNGSGEFIAAAEKAAFANISDIGVTTKFTALAADKNAELSAIVLRREYEKQRFTHILYKDETYRIESTGSAGNDMYIKLILAKGG